MAQLQTRAGLPVTAADLSPFQDSTPLLGQAEKLRARAQSDGYLFFRGLLDPQPILELRRAVLDVLDRHGLRAAGASGLSGNLDLARLNELPGEGMRVDIGVPAEMYLELQKLPELHRLPHHPSLVNLYRDLLGGEVFVHPRHIMRAMTPHPANGPTPPHQDFPLIQGSPETWTSWFPVGDCPLELGPLVVLRGSHVNGYMTTGLDHEGWTNWGVQLCEQETDWVGGDVALGDVLTFPCFTVHRALRPQIRDEIRVSLDVRYQRADDVIEAKSLTNHSGHEWDEIYEGWGEDDAGVMHYWDPDKLSFSPWDDSLLQPGPRRIC